MTIDVIRYHDTGDETFGLLYINGRFECYTLEDERRTEKVFGETRIPEGSYEIVFRTTGGHHARYSQKFPDIHHGMLHVIDVPNFTYILIHIGNTDDDTAGCLLVGTAPGTDGKSIVASTQAYKKMYPKVADALRCGEKVTIHYKAIN